MRAYLLTSATCLVALMATAASAQSPATIQEVIVTATKTGATNLQDTPLAITALTSEMIERSGIRDVRDLADSTPNLLISQNGAFAQVYIRGIGSNNNFAGSDPSSTIHTDGVYLARPAAYLNSFLDVERLEVLRGPQGTLYGRNTVGGTINIISRRPSNQFMGKAQLTAGNYNAFRAEGYVSGPIVQDKVAASLAAMRVKRDPFLKNVVPGVTGIDSEDAWATRGQLRFTPADNLEILVRGDYLEADDVPPASVKLLQPLAADPLVNTTLGNYRRVALNTQAFSERRVWGVSGEIGWRLNENLKLTSLTAYRESRLNTQSDTDGSSRLIRITRQFEDQHQWSEELNLTGDFGRLTFVSGVYLFDEHIVADSTVSNFAPGTIVHPNPTVDTRAWALYGQATYKLTDRLSLTAGIRYTEEIKEFAQRYSVDSIATGRPTATYPRTYSTKGVYEATTPKFGIEYRANDAVMFYASATRGFKSGGFNFASANPAQGFAPEFLWSYEAGFKSDLLERRLRVNGTVFRYNYRDLQVQSFLTPGVIDITNASDAKVDGLELEVLARPTTAFEMGGYLAYLDATYDNYPGALKPGNIPFDASGQRMNSSPKWSYNLFGQYTHELAGGASLSGRVEYAWKGRQFFTPENNLVETQASYGLVNANVTWSSPGKTWQVIAYGRNLGNESFVTTTATFTGVVSGRVGDPRTYGLRLVYGF